MTPKYTMSWTLKLIWQVNYVTELKTREYFEVALKKQICEIM